MVRLLLPFAMFLGYAAAQAQAPEPHFQESGSAAVLAYSTFAHGYRHGYEEGYHAGNADANMGRQQRTKFSDLHGVKTGYSEQLGPRPVFDRGFKAGLKAGYNDGYPGQSFRAVESLRAINDSLEQFPLPADPRHVRFDDGFLAGYDSGLERGGHDQSSSALIDFHTIACAELQPVSQVGVNAEISYCDGYRRGFVLGHADGFVLRTEAARMEASK